MEITVGDLHPGMSFQSMPALIVEKKVAVAKNGKSYADLTVRDKTGILKCKIWNFEDNDAIAVGKVLDITGTTSEYQGEVQATIAGHSPSTRKPDEFAKSTRFLKDVMWHNIQNHISCMHEPITKSVISHILADLKHKFILAPAAKSQHNAWYGGLLEHVASMCDIADSVCEHYLEDYGILFSKDKVMFGVILHDIGKIFEYDYSTPSFQYAGDGMLANHLVIGPAMIYEACNKWFEDLDADNPGIKYNEFERERVHLMHVVAAHHGRPEWGSPVPPASLEAILVHHIDNLDSSFMHAMELVEGKAGQIPGFSEKSYSTKTSYLKYNKEA